jgi:glutamate/tyrosine decarboxylase-like PLP-dependent enzyme
MLHRSVPAHAVRVRAPDTWQCDDMQRTDWTALLERTFALAIGHLHGLPERPVAPRQGPGALLAAFERPVPDEPSDPIAVVDELARLADPGLTAMPGGRFFGWVIGGGLPAAVAADWLTTVWDQNAGSAEGTPAAAAVEQVALRWVAELLELPAASGVLVTGAQMASFVGLAAARSEVLRAAGWDVEADGLTGAPPVRVIVGAERHNTIDKALRLLGFGTRRLVVVEADGDGAMRPDALAAALAGGGPTIVCAQAGNVNGGAFDPMPAIADAVDAARARGPVWLHLDGAFGLWARVSPRRRALAAGVERADSWSTDGHKWLNTPYDCGIALTRHALAHKRALRGAAAYLPGDDEAVTTPFDHAPELSRRARGFALWAALRQLGRRGVADLVDRTCDHATAIAEGLAAVPGVEVMNRIWLNQVVVRFRAPTGEPADDAHTRAVIERTVRGGECYPTATVWRGRAAMRISVSNWSTDADDVRRTIAAITAAHRA